MSDKNTKTISAYNAAAKEYMLKDRAQSREGFYLQWIDELLARVSRPSRILEIGSAYGRDAMYMRSKGFDVRCTDASHAFVSLLREQGIDAQQLDIVNDLPVGEWDFIYASAVFLHFTPDDFRRALAHVHEALSVHGIFACSIIGGDGEVNDDRHLGSSRYFHYYQLDDIKTMLSETGFSLLDTRNEDYRGRKWLYITAQKDQKK